MRTLRRLGRWWRRKRREYRGNAVLREFVYLDEVSVYSLLASRSGPVATEFTESESASLKDEVSGGLGANGAIVRAEVKARVESTTTSGSQVVRKSSAQARFGQLLRDEQDEMSLRAEPRTKEPRAVDVPGLLRLAARADHRDWVIDAAAMKRGAMVEIEVELQAEEVYRVSQAFSSMLEILREDPEMFGVTDASGLREGSAITGLLQQVLVGLVPIRGQASSHKVLRVDDQELLVRNELIDGLATGAAAVEPLDVVGMTEIDLFWKDIRRILFAGDRYTVLCRLGHDGLRRDWTPIKLVDVLRDVAPEVAVALDSTGRGLLSAVRHSTDAESADTAHARFNRLIEHFAVELGETVDAVPTSEDLREAGLLLGPSSPLPADGVEARRALLSPVRDFVEQTTGHRFDPEVVARARSRASLDELLRDECEAERLPAVSPEPVRNVVEVEPIAIYW